jgi:hypothetical protein
MATHAMPALFVLAHNESSQGTGKLWERVEEMGARMPFPVRLAMRIYSLDLSDLSDGPYTTRYDFTKSVATSAG